VERGVLVFVEAGFRLGIRRKEWVQPDVSVVSQDQDQRATISDDYLEGAPLVAIEVISPGNTAEWVERKLGKYFENGAREVWVVYPKTRRVWRYAGLDAPAVVEHGAFTSPLLPAFEMDLAEICK